MRDDGGGGGGGGYNTDDDKCCNKISSFPEAEARWTDAEVKRRSRGCSQQRHEDAHMF